MNKAYCVIIKAYAIASSVQSAVMRSMGVFFIVLDHVEQSKLVRDFLNKMFP